MRDENSERGIRCPYCGVEEECPHVLAIIDKSFNECPSGYASERYEEFAGLIETAFRQLFEKGMRLDIDWGDKNLSELWEGALEHYSPEDPEVFLDPDILTRTIVSLFSASGGERYAASIVDGGGPGLTSSICLFYAKDPKTVFDAAISKVVDALSSSSKR